MFRITPEQLTETVQLLARGILADNAPDRLPVLADAIEEAGRTLDRYESDALRGNHSPDRLPEWVGGMLRTFATETPDSLREKERAAAEVKRVHAFRQSAFARCGLVGCRDSLAALARGITRRRPKGSGSKRDLAARLEDRLNELATRRWDRACKGQRKPTPAQLDDLLARIGEALDAAQGRTKERRIDAADVAVAAARADRTGSGSVDGGRVTANSYGYRWTTTTATAQRLPDGSIRVTIDRTERREVTATAKHWKAALAYLKPSE